MPGFDYDPQAFFQFLFPTEDSLFIRQPRNIKIAHVIRQFPSGFSIALFQIRQSAGNQMRTGPGCVYHNHRPRVKRICRIYAGQIADYRFSLRVFANHTSIPRLLVFLFGNRKPCVIREVKLFTVGNAGNFLHTIHDILGTVINELLPGINQLLIIDGLHCPQGRIF